MKGKDPISGSFVGISLTALIHLAIVAAFTGNFSDSGCGGTARAAPDQGFEKARVIEAALARKKVEKKDNNPQKKKKKKYKPTENRYSRDEKRKPEKKDEPKHKVPVQPDEVDINSVLEKNRSQDDNLSSHGADETPQEGSTNGSIWGTERDAKGDPYVGELFGRIKSEWRVPALERGNGVALGCVRLDDKGKIVKTLLKKRSSNANLDRSVELALKKAPPMEDPVPAHLKELLTVKGICFRFSLEAE